MEHSFDILTAQKYGINAAVILRHLQFWIIKNKAHGKNFHDGRTWTYYSVSGLTKIFRYLTPKQVRRALQVLIDKNVILKGDYNKHKNTRTSWYAFVDEISFAPEGKPAKSSFAPEGKPVAPEGRPVALEGKPVAPEGRPVALEGKPLTDKDKPDKLTDEEPDKSRISQKEDLSSKEIEAEQHAAFSLLICRGVDEQVAQSLVFEQKHPLASIENVIKNGLAKEHDAKRTGGDYRLEPGYIVKALNTARKEGKVVGSTKSSRELSKQLSAKRNAKKNTPLSQEEFEKRKRRNIASLKVEV